MVGITHLCLNPRFKLRTQMMLSFGTTAVIALSAFICIGLYTASNSGKSVQNQARGVVTRLVRRSLSSTAIYVAETMTKQFNNIGGAGSLIAEVTRDRFVGYPNIQGWDTDQFVPFPDMESFQNKYPVDAVPLQLDWNITGNVNELNAEQHLPLRPIGWYTPNRTKVDTTNAGFFMQGLCDPAQTNPNAPTYYLDCTDDNNNVQTGGVVAPTSTNKFIFEKAKDLSWMLKSIYEFHSDVKTMGIFFANNGAGAAVQYPAVQYDGNGTYESIGCEWGYTTHPRTKKFILQRNHVSNCHSRGTLVGNREYNPLERGWCRDQVEWDIELSLGTLSKSAHSIKSTGPYIDVLSVEKPLWVLTFGQAVFDRKSNEFIGCTLVDVSVHQLYEILIGSSNVGDTSESALVRWDDLGTVVAASEWNPLIETEGAVVTDQRLNLGVTPQTWNDIRNLVDYSIPWDPQQVEDIYRNTVFTNNGKLVMTYPVPMLPAEYDPVYKPEYVVIISIDMEEAYGLVDSMDALIEADVTQSWKNIAMVGGIGFAVVILMITYIAATLTKPLAWMRKVAGMIIDNAGGADLKKGLTEELDNHDARPWCAPRTEVTKLLYEFEKMINDFSGEGAAEVAGITVNEVKNRFEWRRMYEDIYDVEKEQEQLDDFGGKVPGTNIPRQLSIITKQSETHDAFNDELTTDSTMRTERSILSQIRSSITHYSQYTQYSSTIETVLTKTSSMVSSVRDLAVDVGAKYGLLKGPEEEKVEGPPFVNRGENIVHPPDPLEDFFEGVSSGDKSFLFWWTTLLVGTPILVTAILISVSVASDTTEKVPVWLQEVKNSSYTVESESIITANNARAYFGRAVMNRFVRDLHIYSRIAGWLLFGAINRTDSFTETLNAANLCKNYEKESEIDVCPFFLNPNNTACDCAWNDASAGFCTDYNGTDTRHLQFRFYEGQNDDIDLVGTRMSSSYPSVGLYPNATNWWNGTLDMPNSTERFSARGHKTTYDRVRVTSAMAIADMPLYNYNPGVGESKNLGTFIGFEYDGMMTGYTGCEHGHVNWPHWQATMGNGAPKLQPLLCPDGKYGYDARCRGWYDGGKNRGGVYITPPYQFASSDKFAGSATFSLVDPISKELVGQALLDFLPDAFMSAVDGINTPIGEGTTGFPIVITPEPDVLGSDVLIGPGYKLGMSASISSTLLPHDLEDSPYREIFEAEVASKMRAGLRGSAIFRRTTEDLKEESVFLSYAPVSAWTLLPVNSSDFTAGVYVNETLIYSIGFGITVNELVLPFTRVEDKVNSDIAQVKYISLALIIAAVLSVLYMTYTMCLYISQPILVLISIVKSIESKQLQDELPKLEGGSVEIVDVYDSLEKLCKIVRFSNAAFFKGDRTKSYKVLEEALELFVKMGNQKALGVANNNLGSMVLQEQMERSSTTAHSNEVYFAGVKYFEEAIRIGTFEYQNAGFDDVRGDYVKQLANRYFNRGMFYIVNRKHPRAAPDVDKIGIKDLHRARSLDEEAYLYWRERGQLVQQARVQFGSLLRRARGMLTLTRDGDFEDIWGVDKLIENAQEMLRNPIYTTSNLFEGVNLVARKQQVNDLRIQYALFKNDTLTAAKIAIKMLVEDEYIIDTVIMNCVTTLNKYYNLHGEPNQVPNLATGVKRETRRGAVDSMRQAKNVIFCLDYSGSMAGERMARANKNLRWVYDEHCLDKDHVGFVRFNHAVDDKLYFDLARKGGNQEVHERILAQAVDAEGGTRLYAALNKCVSMAIDSGNSYDCWIIALTDGESAWDFPAKQVIARIDKHNKQEGPKIHVVIIGFEVSSEVSDSVAAITQVTDKSLYIDARGGGLDEMDSAFEQVASVITGTAITMETF